MRLLFWPDLPAPKEEEIPKLPVQEASLFGGIQDDDAEEENEEEEDE